MLSKVTFTPVVGSAVDLHASTGSYKISRADGIVGPPDPREVSRTAPGRDGTLDDTRFVSERKITLEGEIIGSSQSDVWTKWDALAAAFQSTLLSKGTLTVTLPDGTTQRQTSVVLTGTAQPSFEGGSAYLQYQVNFRAPDPRWYATSTSSLTLTNPSAANVVFTSTAQNMVNSGNAPTGISFSISGGTGSLNDYFKFSVTPPSAYQTYAGASLDLFGTQTAGGVTDFITRPYGSTSTIDTLARTATNTNSAWANLGVKPAANTEWPILYPGTSTIVRTSYTGGSTTGQTIVATWRDAWW